MLALQTVAGLALLSLANAQYGSPGSSSAAPSSAAATTSAAGSASSTASSSAGVHTVTVGANGAFSFTPNSLVAAVGDQVQFTFASSGHSVAESTFASPCMPANASAFYSGFLDSGKDWTLTINSTDPMWFYCSQVTHCQAGMVGVINPPTGQTIDAFTSTAKGTSSSKSPATVQGGLFQAAKAQSSSATSGTASAASGSASASSSASSGGVENRVVSVVGLLIAAGVAGWMVL